MVAENLRGFDNRQTEAVGRASVAKGGQVGRKTAELGRGDEPGTARELVEDAAGGEDDFEALAGPSGVNGEVDNLAMRGPLKIAPGERRLHGIAGARGRAGKLKLFDDDSGILGEGFDGEGHAVGKGFLVGVLEIRGEALHEFVEALRKALRPGVETLGREGLGGGKQDVAAEAEAVGEAGVVGTHNGLSEAGGDDYGGKLLLADDGETQCAGSAAEGFYGHLDVRHGGSGAERAGNGGETILRNRADDGAGVGQFHRRHG